MEHRSISQQITQAVSRQGANGGKNRGRACWAIAGTLCGGKIQGSYAAKTAHCMQCEFFKQVRTEQGPTFERAADILAKLG